MTTHTNKKSRLVYASDETWEEVKRIGGGNVSKGVRVAAHGHEPIQNLLSELYQILGDLGASEEVLDQVLAAMEGEELPYETLLPYGEWK